MTELQRQMAVRRDNTHICKKLSKLLDRTFSLRWITTPAGDELAYIQCGGTAYSGYLTPDGVNLILKGMESIALHASAKASRETADHLETQYYKNPHRITA